MHNTALPIEYADLPAGPTDSFWMQRLDRLTFIAPPSPPHRHGYQELLVVESGHGTHQIDGDSFELAPQTVSLIAQGQIHYLERAVELEGYLVRFGADFLPAGAGDDADVLAWDYRATLFNHFGLNRALQLAPAEMAALSQLLGLLAAEYGSAAFQRENSLRHLLALVLIRLERLSQARLRCGKAHGTSYRLYQDFAALLERHFTAQHDVAFYARALEVTPDRLARSLSRLTGKTTKQLISERVLLEAQRFLRYTARPIGEISDQLGFSDQFQFSKAFKRALGVAPLSFRAHRRILT